MTTHPFYPVLSHKLKTVIICVLLGLGQFPTLATETDSIQVSFMTCGAGKDVYELCGHSALRVKHANGLDYVVNYGLFDFDSPNFLYRFVSGQTDYKAGAQATDYFLAAYDRHGRSVKEYVLNLTDNQKERLDSLLRENVLPANCTYRYNYVKDNCATRPLCMIERAIGDSITFMKEPADIAGWSFRDEMTWFHRNYPWYQFGIDLALGSGIDYPLTIREKGFAPLMLDSLLHEAYIPDSTGSLQPLVTGFSTIVPGAEGGVSAGPTPWYLRPVAVFWALFVLVLAVSIRDMLKRTDSKWLDTILFGTYGLAGCVIMFLIFCSEHEATSPNWLAVGLNPLCFIGAIFPWIPNFNKLLYYYHTANFIVLFIMICAWPFTGQAFNLAFWPLLLMDMLRSDTYRMIWKCKKANTYTVRQK